MCWCRARVAGVGRAREAGGWWGPVDGAGVSVGVGVGVGVVPEEVAGAGPAHCWGRTRWVACYTKVVVVALVCRVESVGDYRALAGGWDCGPGCRVFSNKVENRWAPLRESDGLVLVGCMYSMCSAGPQVVCCGRGVGA